MHEIPDEIAEKATSIQLGARLFVHVPADLGRSLAAENDGVIPSYEQLAARSSVCVDEDTAGRVAKHLADREWGGAKSWPSKVEMVRDALTLAAVSSPPEPETAP